MLETAADGSYAPFSLAGLQARHVDAYISRRRAEKAHEATIAKELVTLRASLKLAVRAGLWLGNPAAVLPIGFAPEYRPRDRFLTPDELAKLLGALLPDQAARVAFIVATSATGWASSVANHGLEFLPAKYDARNRRVARQVNGQWTYFVADAYGHPLGEFVLTNDPGVPWIKSRDYIWLDDQLLVQVEYPDNGASTGSCVYYAHVDALGTPRSLTNATGDVMWSTAYDPYGAVREHTMEDPVSRQTVVTNLRLPGQYDERLLGSLGLQGPYYNWNRWYLPGVGRYLELDPAAVVGKFNGGPAPQWYSYAQEDPLRFVDRDGFAPKTRSPAGTTIRDSASIWAAHRSSTALERIRDPWG